MGAHLCSALHEAGHIVRAFDRPVPPHLVADHIRGPVEWVYGDFANRKDVTDAIAECDVVFHLISTTLPKNSNDNPIYDVETNLVPTLGLLEAARIGKVKRVVFASSGGTVYGRPIQTPIAETHPTNPICAYGITTLAIEKYRQLYHSLHGLDYLVLRLANPFGEGQRPDAAQGAVSVFMNRALSDIPIEIWGDGTVVRDYVHVSDVTNAFLRAVNYDGDCRVMNIGAGHGHSINALLDVMEEVLGRPITRYNRPARGFDVPVNVLDSSQARTQLGWEARVPLREGLIRTLDWFRRSVRP